MDSLFGRIAQRGFRSAIKTTSSYFGSQNKRLLNASTSAKPAGNNQITFAIGIFAVLGVMNVSMSDEILFAFVQAYITINNDVFGDRVLVPPTIIISTLPYCVCPRRSEKRS